MSWTVVVVSGKNNSVYDLIVKNFDCLPCAELYQKSMHRPDDKYWGNAVLLDSETTLKCLLCKFMPTKWGGNGGPENGDLI